MIPLFERFPLLHRKLPYVSLADLPTPIQRLNRLGVEIGVDQLYIKRDDLTGEVYGGNKVRKLEFLLGDALRNDVKEVMTFGTAGSNHAVATAIYARKVGLKSISMLMPQQNEINIRQNLLMSYASVAELHHYPKSRILEVATKYELIRHRIKTGKTPYVVPYGGTSVLGTVSFVNAALELNKQVDQGLLPKPDYIYVALGSAGTAVGLIIGLKLVNMKSCIIPICVVYSKEVDEKRISEHFDQTVAYLRSLDSSFPTFNLSEKDVDIIDCFLGKGYTHFTEEGMMAVGLMNNLENIKLDGTYTGKTLAALIHTAINGKIKDSVVLYWNTMNSRDFSKAIADIAYQQLPWPFHRYFKQEVQPLDRVVSKCNSLQVRDMDK